MGWFTGANWMQKNASFKSIHEKQVASSGIRDSKVYTFGTTGCSHCCLIDCLEILHWVVPGF
jgi:hypothetical protein